MRVWWIAGNPVTPANAPTLVNDAANSKLRITFGTPGTDNAGE